MGYDDNTFFLTYFCVHDSAIVILLKLHSKLGIQNVTVVSANHFP